MKDNFKDPFIDRWFEIGRQQGLEEGRQEGLEEGRRLGFAIDYSARILLRCLATRGIAISEQARARIDECRDLDQILSWTARAVTSTTADEVFGT